MCELAGVSRSGYYKWLRHADQPDKDHNDYLKIKEVFDQGKGAYGWRSIKMYLPDMNHKKIQRIMRKYGLMAKVRRKNPYKAAYKKTKEHRIFPNKLKRKFKQVAPHTVFSTDITYIPFKSRFAYLSVVKDIATGEVIAWNTSERIDVPLVVKTIKRMPSDLCGHSMIHSDQGFHYTSPAFIEAVKTMKMNQSMSRKGNCIDNAPIESFFGHMKDELDYTSCTSFKELSAKVDEYMRYYNYERKQWSKNKMTPVEYRNHLLPKVEGLP